MRNWLEATLARGVRDVVGMRIERLQMRALLRQQIDGPPLRLAVDAHIGDGVEPELRRRLNRAELSQFEPAQEVLFDVAHPRFHAALLVAAGHIARRDGEAVVAGEVQIAGIEHRRGAGQALQNRRFEIVHHDLGRHAAESGEGVFVAGEEVLHGLGDGELHEHLAAVSQHHDEERQPAAGIAHRDGSLCAPVDLRALAGCEVQLQIDRPPGRPDTPDVIPQDRHAALVAFLAQTLEDLLSAIRVRIQQPGDMRLERIEEAAARRTAPRARSADAPAMPRPSPDGGPAPGRSA